MHNPIRARRWTGSGRAASLRLAGFVAVVSAAFVAACSDASTSPISDHSVPARIQLAMQVAELDRGDTARAEVVVLNGRGMPIASPGAGLPKNVAPIAFTSSDPSIADVSRSGLVLAQRAGEVEISATSGNLSSSSRVNVLPRGKLLTVAPKVDTLAVVGHTLALTAAVLGPNGRELVNPPVSWTSLNPQVAEVDPRGIVRAVATGIAMIVASSGNLADTARVIVGGSPGTQPLPAVGSVEVWPGDNTVTPGQGGQFRATVRDGAGNVINGVPVVWSSSDTDVVSIDSRGVAAARSPGVAVIRGTYEGKSGTATITVVSSMSPQPLPTVVEVAPANATINVAGTVQLSATVRDQNGALMEGVSLEWSSSNGTVATVDHTGRVTGVSGGIASVRARAGEAVGFSAVTVVAAPSPPSTPPGGAARPNEPAGFTRWLEHDFSYLPGLNEGRALSHAGVAGSRETDNHSIVADPTDPTGGGYAMRIRYPAGMRDGSAPGRFWAWDQASQSSATPLREWYVSVWIMLEGPDWESPPNELKLWYNGVGRGGEPSRGGVVTLRYGGAANGIRACRRTYMASRPTRHSVITGWSDNLTGGESTFCTGQWVHLEFYGSLSTPGQRDGVYRIWRDGVLVNERLDVQNQDADEWTTGFYEFSWTPVWGGSCGETRCPKLRDDYMRIAHLYISGIPQ